MKILFVISAWGIGGEQRAASILINEFLLKGHSVDVLTFKSFDKIIKLNPKARVTIIKSSNSIPLFKNYNRIQTIRNEIKNNDYEVIIGFAIIPSILVSIACIGLNKIVIVSERSDPKIYNMFYKISRRLAYRFADGAVFQTNNAKQYFKWLSNVKKIVIQNPLDLSLLPAPNRGGTNKRIVTIGRLVEVKNHRLLIDAFAKIYADFPEYKLAIYGDGILKNDLNSYIKQKSLDSIIKIYDAVPDILERIRYDEIFVLSSNHEGFPNALVEAMAIGLTVISTDCRIGAPKDIIDGNNGVLVKVGDVDDMAKAIRICLSDIKLRKSLSSNAVRIKDELNSNLIAKRWLSFMEELLKNKL